MSKNAIVGWKEWTEAQKACKSDSRAQLIKLRTYEFNHGFLQLFQKAAVIVKMKYFFQLCV